MLNNPPDSPIQDLIVYVDYALGLGESLQHECGEPQAAVLVALAEGGEAAVVAAIGQLPLVAGYHQVFSLGHDLRLDLSSLLQVLGDENVGGEEDHVLLSAAERHPQQPFKPFDGLAEIAAGQRDLRPGRPWYGPGRHCVG